MYMCIVGWGQKPKNTGLEASVPISRICKMELMEFAPSLLSQARCMTKVTSAIVPYLTYSWSICRGKMRQNGGVWLSLGDG